MSHVAADARLEPAADDWTETPDIESGSKSEDDHTSDPAAGALPQLLDRAPRLIKRPVAYAVSQTDSMLKTLGRYVDLVVQSFAFLISDIVRLRHPWQDTVIQSWFILTVTVVPAILVSIPFGVIVAVQAGSIISQVGASSISGAVGWVSSSRAPPSSPHSFSVVPRDRQSPPTSAPGASARRWTPCA